MKGFISSIIRDLWPLFFLVGLGITIAISLSREVHIVHANKWDGRISSLMAKNGEGDGTQIDLGKSFPAVATGNMMACDVFGMYLCEFNITLDYSGLAKPNAPRGTRGKVFGYSVLPVVRDEKLRLRSVFVPRHPQQGSLGMRYQMAYFRVLEPNDRTPLQWGTQP